MAKFSLPITKYNFFKPHSMKRFPSFCQFSKILMDYQYEADLGLSQLVYLPCQRVQPGPNRAFDSQVSTENIIYKAFVLIGEIRRQFSKLFPGGKDMCKESLNYVKLTCLHFSFSTCSQCREIPPQFFHHNKSFLNYVICTNWAVRNPARTRLDSLAQ